MSPPPTATRDLARLSLLTAATSLAAYASLQLLARAVPAFDASHTLAGTAEPGLRWDALHFQAIALRGYVYEQQLAFQPGWQGVLALLYRAAGAHPDAPNTGGFLRAAVAANVVARVVANAMLYKLTRALFSRKLAVVSSVLYAFPPAPAILAAPYTEPPFAALFFSALYLSVVRRWAGAALCFAAAVALRPTAVLGALVLAAHVVFAPPPTGRAGKTTPGAQVWKVWFARLPRAAALCALIPLPFLAFQAYAYYSFCVPTPTRPWCSLRLPLSYTWVQREYWDVGPFRYWTLAQLPNFCLAAPVVLVSAAGCWRHLASQPRALATLSRPAWPIYAYQALMLAVLVVSSHTQIALRLALTDPVLWWTVGESLLARGAGARRWVWWCAVWGALSLVLWAGHYPPA